MFLRLAFIIALFLPMPAAAQVAQLAQGHWSFAIEGTPVFLLRVEQQSADEGAGDGADEDAGWSGTWVRPKSFASNGVIFRALMGPAVEVYSSRSRIIGEWIEFTFDDPRPGAVPDVFLIRALPDGTAEAVYAETGFAPFILTRVLAGERIGPWDNDATYMRPGLDLASAGPLIQFSSGISAIVSRLEKLILSQQDEQQPPKSVVPESGLPEAGSVALPENASDPANTPANTPAMVGR